MKSRALLKCVLLSLSLFLSARLEAAARVSLSSEWWWHLNRDSFVSAFFFILKLCERVGTRLKSAAAGAAAGARRGNGAVLTSERCAFSLLPPVHISALGRFAVVTELRSVVRFSPFGLVRSVFTPFSVYTVTA